MTNSSSFSILFWTNKAKATNNGMVPLYARVTVDGRRAEISLKKKLSLKKWDASTGFIKGSGDEVRITNKYINEVSNDLFEIYAGLRKADLSSVRKRSKNKFTGQAALLPPGKTLLEVFDEHSRDVESLVGRDYVNGTLTKYKTIRTKVYEYIQHQYHREDLMLEELDFIFISNFERFLKIQAGIEHNTVMGYIKRVKRIMTIAVNNRWVFSNPFMALSAQRKR